jgi:hypothetical protein
MRVPRRTSRLFWQWPGEDPSIPESLLLVNHMPPGVAGPPGGIFDWPLGCCFRQGSPKNYIQCHWGWEAEVWKLLGWKQSTIVFYNPAWLMSHLLRCVRKKRGPPRIKVYRWQRPRISSPRPSISDSGGSRWGKFATVGTLNSCFFFSLSLSLSQKQRS